MITFLRQIYIGIQVYQEGLRDLDEEVVSAMHGGREGDKDKGDRLQEID